MKLGIVGLPNVGKSTIFNAMTKANVEVANYPFCTINPNIGITMVPDKRLDILEKVYNAKNKIYTTVKFIDIAGIIKGASHGNGLGNRFLSYIREANAIVHVVRCFTDINISHVMGNINPIRDIDIINTELLLSDIDFISNIIKKNKEKVSLILDKKKHIETIDFLTKIKNHLNTGKFARTISTISNDENNILARLNLITSKPMIYACNISEIDLFKKSNYFKDLITAANNGDAKLVLICAKIEEEVSKIRNNKKMLKEFNINISGLDKLINIGYKILGLQTFFTAGVKEVRAWTIKNGTSALEASAIIHSDFKKGFIRAEVMNFNDFIKFNNEKLVKNSGLLRSEGKKYIIKDGDIINFRFNI
ncbi:MAG: redox-regulated ATPase YchF [Endomicrobium sp.]|nr:redox-regulated ATPase YchF [Endomicrobium sp.]